MIKIEQGIFTQLVSHKLYRTNNIFKISVFKFFGLRKCITNCNGTKRYTKFPLDKQLRLKINEYFFDLLKLIN